MNLAPIILFVYNRPDHTEQTLEALMQNELASGSELFIFADGPKKDSAADTLKNMEATRHIIRKKKWCGKVSIIESETNKGLANSIIDGVTKIVNEFGKIIVLEDDLVTSAYFLKFMNDALNIYISNDDVVCISGYTYPVKKSLPETFFIKGADCWGWATWKRAWNNFEKDGKKLLNEIESEGLGSAFDFDNSYNYTQMLRDQVNGKNSSWAVRWYASAFLKNKYCLYPGISFVQNIGIDGSGTHSGNSDKWSVDIASHPIIIKPIAVAENNAAKKMIISYFQESNGNEHIVKKMIKRIYHKIFPESPKYGWFGNYINWSEAQKKCTGYDDAGILEKVKTSLLKVKNGEAVYERDSVLFDKIEYSWPLLAGLMWLAAQNEGSLNIIDFGGSLGSSYFQNKTFLGNLKEIKWNIVEQEKFITCGKEFFENKELKFFNSIEECINNQKPNLILLSCVLPYIEKPYELLNEIFSYGFRYIIFDRMPFFEDDVPHRITIHKVNPQIYTAIIPTHIFNESEFIKFMKKKYELISDFDNGPGMKLSDGTRISNKGFIYRIKP